MTETLAEELVIEAAPTEAPAPQKPLEEPDLRRLSRQKPPSRGLCRRCGENKPVNRLMLCYPCWVKTELEKHGWREGQSHPDWCGCEGSSAHSRLSDGN